MPGRQQLSCVRIHSGLMDLMKDDEVRGVVGHEIGHVALGHSKKAMQVAYAAGAARQVAAASGNSAVAALSSSDIGAIAESCWSTRNSRKPRKAQPTTMPSTC